MLTSITLRPSKFNRPSFVTSQKNYSAYWHGATSQGLSNVRHRIRALSFISWYLYPSDRGVYITFKLARRSAAPIPYTSIVSMAGDSEHRGAIPRVDDLIATLQLNSMCYVIQAHAQRATTRHGKQQLQASNTII